MDNQKDKDNTFDLKRIDNEEVNEVSPNQSKQILRQVMASLEVHRSSSSYSSPLPPPEMLVEYDKALSGSAEKILKMVETQSAHRQDLERAVITSNIKRADKGLIFGFILACLGLAASVYLAINGHDVVAGGIFAGVCGTGIGAFIYGSKAAKEERSEKSERLQPSPEKTSNKE